MMSALGNDFRFGWRAMRRRPGFAAAVVCTLAVGVGANTAIFTVVRAVLLRQLPFARGERLVAISLREPGSDRQPFSIADFLDLRAGTRSLDVLVAWGGWSANLTGVEEPVTLQAQWASSGFFSVLGVHAALGRTPLPEEERPGGSRVVLLGDGLWRSRFGGDTGILGRALILNGEPYTVIGVLPREFPFLASGAQLVAPLVLETDKRRTKRAAGFLRVVGRLQPGTRIDAATRELDAIVARLRSSYPDTNAGKQGVRIEPLASSSWGATERCSSCFKPRSASSF